MTEQKKRTVVMGNFDGLHKGHRKLIRLGRIIADKNGEELAVFTFYPQIRELTTPGFRYLLTDEQKHEGLRRLDVDVVESVPFCEEIASLPPETFVKDILKGRLNANHVVVGFNNSFGYKGKGTPDLLEELGEKYGFKVTVMEPCLRDTTVISSTAIRKYLCEGDVEKAHEFLGYPYGIEGKVQYGNQIGRTIGFPTANIELNPKILLPKNGVYAVKTYVDGKEYIGILNIGRRPTVKKGTALTAEVNIFDFDQDIYGKEIRSEFYYFLRDEVKFDSLEELKAQLEYDENRTRQLFAEE